MDRSKVSKAKRVGGDVGEVGSGLTNGVLVARVRSLLLFCFCFLISISILFYLFTLLKIFFFIYAKWSHWGMEQRNEMM